MDRRSKVAGGTVAVWLSLVGGVLAETGRPAGADVADTVRAQVEADWLAADAQFSARHTAVPEVARAEGLVNQYGVTTSQDAAGGCDGVRNGRWGFHTASGETDPWWQVDLGADRRLDRVVVFNRTDRGTAGRTAKLEVLVSRSDAPNQFETVYRHTGQPFGGAGEGEPLVVALADRQIVGRFVRLRVPGKCSFALDEVEVYPVDAPQDNIALHRPADQKSVGSFSYPGTLPEGVDSAPPPGYVPPTARFTLAHIREVIGRAGQLAERLRSLSAPGEPSRSEEFARSLATISQRVDEAAASGEVPEEVRRELYLAACRLARDIAFSNPLLQIDRLLFIKRHDPGGVFHMCDQFYGCNAVPGGGLFALVAPFGSSPRLVNLLEENTVESGRLAGRKLQGGAFLSPEVAFDGQTVYFAYSQAAAWAKYQGKEAYEWTPECCYHIFRCRADGSGLVQLTDGAWDDFDPCVLPGGRVAMISLRRGGYLRCGRNCPVYTLFSMRPDGSDIVCLSYHETHEWQPSVTHDGMLVYTRWDYVDRDTNVAHHPWICYPDGRDPRSFHGNYPERRESRPWMEMNIRAVPGSQKYVAVTGAHHGHAFGSLVLIDPRPEDDGAVSQLERLTPEVPFPEAEGKPIAPYMIYGAPWPLSEDDYLCVYGADAKNRGIYWIDRQGNRELIYRDPEISCDSPMPLAARPTPPVIPSATTQAGEDRADRPATVAVMNVYDSDFAWPAGARIDRLRIIQVLPKSTPPPNVPRIGVADQTNARAVLGTVPVETDGSAYFEAPVGKPIYFQALDEQGLAIQSMRSATYVHPGEQLTCQGCHEPKRRGPGSVGAMPLALQRGPSAIEPDVDGSNPFNYVRLVQDVLDRNCVACHQEKNAMDLTGTLDGPNGWSRSYTNLAARYGFYFHVGNGSINSGVHGGARTTPGAFGARVAPLASYLDERHYGVRLSAGDHHRLTLWLDCNSEFFGSYEETDRQARGEVVRAALE